jgi:oligoribonuclease (3'-5' exoribonuclease)
MKYVSVDIETTSLDPESGQILELAMVVEETDHQGGLPIKDRPIENLPSFVAVVSAGEEEPIRGDAKALAMNQRLLYAIAKGEGKSRAAVESAACEWLTAQLGSKPVIMAAKNGAGFDLVWIKRHMPMLGKRFSHRVIDPGSVLIDWNVGPVSLGKILGGEAKHEALADARDNIRALRRAYT